MHDWRRIRVISVMNGLTPVEKMRAILIAHASHSGMECYCIALCVIATLALRAGMTATSMRHCQHVTVHIGALGLADQQVHGHGGRRPRVLSHVFSSSLSLSPSLSPFSPSRFFTLCAVTGRTVKLEFIALRT